MLRLSRSNPRKKYEIDIKCDLRISREKSGECMKNDDFGTSSQFQAAEASKLTSSVRRQFARPVSRARPITGTSTRDKFPMKGRRNLSSGGGTGSTLRRTNQVFSKSILN